MSQEAAEALKLLHQLAEELAWRQSDVRLYEDYYRGAQGKLQYASEQFGKFFSDRYKSFSDNWCGTVADAPTERLEVKGFRTNDPKAKPDTDLWRVWRENDADFYSDQAFLDAIIAKRSYMLVWGNPDDESTPRITWEHPSQAIVSYDPETGARRAGLKSWTDGDMQFATLYTPDAIWKWQRSSVREGRTESGLYVVGVDGGWKPRQPSSDNTWPVPNPMSVVPLVEMPNRPRLIGEPLSDIAGAKAMQDATNLLWGYLLNAADYASFPQRVVLGAERPMMPVLDEDGQVKGEKPVPMEKFRVDRMIWLSDPNAKVAEWSAANLSIYTDTIETCVSHLAAQSRTPPHYLMSKIVNANAETLKTAETGLVKRTEEKTESFGRGIREGSRLVCLAQGNEAKAREMRGGKVLWKDIEIRSEAQAIDAAMKLHTMGYPIEYLSRRIGIDPDEVVEILEMRRREQAESPTAKILRGMTGQEDADAVPAGIG